MGRGLFTRMDSGSSWDISACLTIGSVGKRAFRFCQGQNSYCFAEKNVQQCPTGWDHGQMRAEGGNREEEAISSGAFVCSEREALIKDIHVPTSRRQTYFYAYWLPYQLSQTPPRHGTELQGFCFCFSREMETRSLRSPLEVCHQICNAKTPGKA